MRALGVSASQDVDGKQLKAQFKQADRLNAKLVVVLGDEELSRNEVTVKNLASGEQTSIAFDGAAEKIAGQLKVDP